MVADSARHDMRTASVLVPKVPTRSGDETSERTRGSGGPPHHGKSISPRRTRRRQNFRLEWGLGTGCCKRDAVPQPPPTAGSLHHDYEFLTLLVYITQNIGRWARLHIVNMRF